MFFQAHHASVSLRPCGNHFKALGALLLVLAMLSGCGGGGGGGAGGAGGGGNGGAAHGGDAEAGPRFAATLSTVKQLTLTWTAPALAQRAVIHEDADGDGPLPAEPRAEVAASDGAVTIEIFLPRALNATYRLAFCNGTECIEAASLQLTGTLEQGMGKLKAVTYRPDSWFGAALALSADGRVLAVGALFDPIPHPDGTTTLGSVHLFERTPGGAWQPRGEARAPQPGEQDNFSAALALSADGSVLAVGAPRQSAPTATDEGFEAGGAYVFRRQDDQWNVEAHLRGSAVDDGDSFGFSLALSAGGDTLVVGAPYSNVPNTTETNGAAYVFTQVGNQWTEEAVLREGGDATNNFLGAAVAISGDATVVAVGSPGHESAGIGAHATPIADTFDRSNTGAVFVYRRTVANVQPWALEAFVKAPMDLGRGRFGAALALDNAGDTLAVSAPSSSHTVEESGSVHIFEHGQQGWRVAGDPLQESTRVTGNRFGRALALSADGQALVVGVYNNSISGTGLSRDGQGSGTTAGIGAAEVFQHRGDAWARVAVLRPSDSGDPKATEYLGLGQAVAIGGEEPVRTIGLGTPYHDGPGSGIAADPTGSYVFDPPHSDTGVVYLY